jgi:lysophospholipase L1-like esterase
MKSWHAVFLGLLMSLSSAQAGAAEWVATWGAAPLPPSPAEGPRAATPGFANQTIRQIVRVSAGGKQLRIRFTNEFGRKPLAIGAAHVALADAQGNVQPGTDHAITFAGSPSTLIPEGAPMLSDAVNLSVKPLATLSISIYLPEDTGPCTCHALGMQTAYVSETGDFTSKPFTPKEKLPSRAFISGIEVEPTTPTKVIAVLGDSITDGVGSTPETNRRWPDLLAARLAERNTRTSWGVVNMGISGNRLLNDGAGQNALARFDRDVLSVPGVRYVIVFLGVNDLGLSFGEFQGPLAEYFKAHMPAHKATAETMIAAYGQLIERAHANGVKIFGATIAPYEGAAYYSSAGNAVRESINTWMRTSGAFDAVLDFDKAFRDPERPTQMGKTLHSGDHLHGSDAGYAAVAESIDLSLFK